MAEGLTTADGKPVDLAAAQTQFAKAMAAPPPDPDIPAPPKREVPQLPADDGQDHQGDKPKPKPKPKPRVKTAAPVKADYTAEAQEFVGNAWLLAAVIPYTSPYAIVISGSRDALVPALAEGAKHSETIRQWVAGTSEHAWKAHLALAAAQMSMQAWQIYRDPELRKQASEQTRRELAEMLGTVSEDSADGGTPSS
jgi:hypothetical protein